MALHGVVHTARLAVERHLNPGDIAVDATVGAGFDTLFMARAVGPAGRVYGFDIQDEALERARATLCQGEVMERVTLFKAGHERMPEFLPEEIYGKIKAITFNLGYLPGSDQQVTTTAETSLAAIETAMELVHPRGIVSVAIYSGHPQGENEKRALKEWAAGIPYDRFRIARYEFINKSSNQEVLLLIEKVGRQGAFPAGKKEL